MEVLGTSTLGPGIGAGPHKSGFRGDLHRSVGMQRFEDELFGDVGTVRVSGVDKVHAQLDGSTQYRNALLAVIGVSPNTVTSDPHRAVAESLDCLVRVAEGLGIRGRIVHTRHPRGLRIDAATARVTASMQKATLFV